MTILSSQIRNPLFAPAARWLRRIALRTGLALVLSALAAPALADPMTLILLKILRDQLITRTLEAAWERRPVAPQAEAPQTLFTAAPASLFAPTLTENLNDQQIRQLVDDGFVHLNAGQREEVYAGLQRILSDPEHASSRQVILEEFASKGLAARQAHEQLRQLSAAEKQRVAEHARAEYARLSHDERQQIVQVLRAGAAPIPRDLSDSLLAQFSAVNSQ
jgi:hypothetical protein